MAPLTFYRWTFVSCAGQSSKNMRTRRPRRATCGSTGLLDLPDDVLAYLLQRAAFWSQLAHTCKTLHNIAQIVHTDMLRRIALFEQEQARAGIWCSWSVAKAAAVVKMWMATSVLRERVVDLERVANKRRSERFGARTSTLETAARGVRLLIHLKTVGNSECVFLPDFESDLQECWNTLSDYMKKVSNRRADALVVAIHAPQAILSARRPAWLRQEEKGTSRHISQFCRKWPRAVAQFVSLQRQKGAHPLINVDSTMQLHHGAECIAELRTALADDSDEDDPTWVPSSDESSDGE